MKVSFLVVLIFLLQWSAQTSFAQLSDYFEEADEFFSTYVRDGQVDYTGVKVNASDLGRLLKTADNYSSEKLAASSAEEQKAFYINTYNLLVIATVVSNPGISSPLDVPGFFDQKLHTVAGEEMTLNQLEKQKLLATYGDARFHFVLVCAAKDCPPLASEAYFPNKLEKQLDARTRLAINADSFIRLNAMDETVAISELFKWYYKDFGARTETEARAFVNFINEYRSTPLPTDHSVEFYPYDWQLNQYKR